MAITPTKETQEYKVLQIIKRRKLSQLVAAQEYGIYDLAGRIKRLEEKGHKISRSRAARYNERGKEVTHWTEYRLVKE